MITVIAALRLGYPVVVPLIVAVFIIATAWPARNLARSRMPIALSYIGTVIALMVVFLALVAIANYAMAEIAPLFYARLGDFRSLYNGCASRARDNDPPIDQTVLGFERLLGLARAFLSKLYTVLTISA